jgi:hypothetical protein
MLAWTEFGQHWLVRNMKGSLGEICNKYTVLDVHYPAIINHLSATGLTIWNLSDLGFKPDLNLELVSPDLVLDHILKLDCV